MKGLDHPFLTRDHAFRVLAHDFRGAGLASPELDARLLVMAAARCREIDMIRDPGMRLGPEVAAVLAHYRERRLAREPVSRILGRREFWGLSFSLSGATLDPRPDSEVLVEAAIAALDGRVNPRVLDLGTGTGCLLLAVLSDVTGATGVGIDISPEAVSLAHGNALQLGLEHRAVFHQGNWTDGLDERFDLVISNPPYIPRADIAGLEPEVRTFDPQTALDGGVDGLDAYRLLAGGLGRVLNRDGTGIIELGAGQAEAVSGLFSAAGLAIERVADDLGGVPRALIVTN
ncbi:MAG: peptide chain release factor N(5)-glutamine methyltransferase [Parvibaculaceae bacterium]|nr:peptide chain release factor N(5)-glutamine methyltransferase [Parvibaculaceae bacterium]